MNVQKTKDLKGAAHDVCYEMLQLQDALAYRTRCCSGGKEASLARILLETFLLHYRNVRDFLENQKQKQDDVIGRDFCRWRLAEKWPDHINDPRAAADNRYSERALINKLLAHVTYFREEIRAGSPRGISWPLADMYATATAKFLDFTEKLSPERQQLFSECASRLRLSAFPMSQDGISSETGTPEPAIHLGGLR